WRPTGHTKKATGASPWIHAPRMAGQARSRPSERQGNATDVNRGVSPGATLEIRSFSEVGPGLAPGKPVGEGTLTHGKTRQPYGWAVRPLLFGLCRCGPRSPPKPASWGGHFPRSHTPSAQVNT